MTYILRQEACGNGVRTHTRFESTGDKDNLSPADLPALDLATSSCGFLTRVWWFPSEE